jgi:hypothetical protein
MASVKLRALSDIDTDLFVTWLHLARDLGEPTGDRPEASLTSPMSSRPRS